MFAFYGGQDIWDVFAESDAAVAATWKWPPLSQTLFADLTDNVKAAVEAGTPLTDAYARRRPTSSPPSRTRASRSPSDHAAGRPCGRPAARRQAPPSAVPHPRRLRSTTTRGATVTATTALPPTGRHLDVAPTTRARRRRPRSPAALWVLLLPFLVMFAAFFVAPIVFAIVDSLFSLQSSGLGLGRPDARVRVPRQLRRRTRRTRRSSRASAGSSPSRRSRCRSWSSPRSAWRSSSALPPHVRPRLFRVTYFMPYGVPGVIAALLWGFLYIPATSPVLQVLGAFGIDVESPRAPTRCSSPSRTSHSGASRATTC